MAALAVLMLVLTSIFAGAVTAESGATAEEDAPRVVQQTAISGDYVCKSYYTNQLRFVFSPSCGQGEMLIQISASLPFDYCYSLYTGIISDDLNNNTCSGFGSVYVEIDGLSSFFACVNPYTGQMRHTTAADGCPAGTYVIGFIDLRGDITKYACVEENLNHNECDVIPPAPTQNEIRHLEQVTPTPFINSTFRLEFRGDQTPVISASTAADMSAPEIEALLEALPSIGVGNVSVTALDPGELWTTAADIFGTPDIDESTPIRVEFTGALGNQDITDPILIASPISVSGGTEHTVIDGSAGASPGVNNVMPGGTVQVFQATGTTDPNNPATYGPEVTAGPQAVAADGSFSITDLMEGSYVVCADGTDSVAPSCELVEINDNELSIVNNVDLPGTITAEITDIAGTNEVQTVSQCAFGCAVTGGTFTLTFDGQTTAAIDADATTAEVQSALEGLSNIDPGDVAVTGQDFILATFPGQVMSVEFTGQYAGQDVPEMTIVNSLTGSGFALSYSVATTTQGSGEIHTLTLDVRVSGGTFTLTYDNGVTSSTTGPIAWDATVGDVEAALNGLASITSGGGSVTVSSTDPGFPPEDTKITKAPFEVNFSGVAGADTNVLVVDNTNLE